MSYCTIADCELHNRISVDRDDLRYLLNAYLEGRTLNEEDREPVTRLWRKLNA